MLPRRPHYAAVSWLAVQTDLLHPSELTSWIKLSNEPRTYKPLNGDLVLRRYHSSSSRSDKSPLERRRPPFPRPGRDMSPPSRNNEVEQRKDSNYPKQAKKDSRLPLGKLNSAWTSVTRTIAAHVDSTATVARTTASNIAVAATKVIEASLESAIIKAVPPSAVATLPIKALVNLIEAFRVTVRRVQLHSDRYPEATGSPLMTSSTSSPALHGSKPPEKMLLRDAISPTTRNAAALLLGLKTVVEKHAVDKQRPSFISDINPPPELTVELLHTATLAHAAYQPNAVDLLRFCRSRGTPCTVVHVGSPLNHIESKVPFYLLEDEATGDIVVTFRGTQGLADILVDLVSGSTPFLDSYAHEGMVKTARALFTPVCRALERHLAVKYAGIRFRHAQSTYDAHSGKELERIKGEHEEEIRAALSLKSLITTGLQGTTAHVVSGASTHRKRAAGESDVLLADEKRVVTNNYDGPVTGSAELLPSEPEYLLISPILPPPPRSDEELEALESLADPTFKVPRIVFTGHSLGGGIATLVALLIRQPTLLPYRTDPTASPLSGFPSGNDRQSRRDREMLLESALLAKLNPVCRLFAPPACLSPELAQRTSSFVVTAVLGDDIVPRLSEFSVAQLLLEMHAEGTASPDLSHLEDEVIKLLGKLHLTKTDSPKAPRDPLKRSSTVADKTSKLQGDMVDSHQPQNTLSHAQIADALSQHVKLRNIIVNAVTSAAKQLSVPEGLSGLLGLNGLVSVNATKTSGSTSNRVQAVAVSNVQEAIASFEDKHAGRQSLVDDKSQARNAGNERDQSQITKTMTNDSDRGKDPDPIVRDVAQEDVQCTAASAVQVLLTPSLPYHVKREPITLLGGGATRTAKRSDESKVQCILDNKSATISSSPGKAKTNRSQTDHATWAPHLVRIAAEVSDTLTQLLVDTWRALRSEDKSTFAIVERNSVDFSHIIISERMGLDHRMRAMRQALRQIVQRDIQRRPYAYVCVDRTVRKAYQSTLSTRMNISENSKPSPSYSSANPWLDEQGHIKYYEREVKCELFDSDDESSPINEEFTEIGVVTGKSDPSGLTPQTPEEGPRQSVANHLSSYFSIGRAGRLSFLGSKTNTGGGNLNKD